MIKRIILLSGIICFLFQTDAICCKRKKKKKAATELAKNSTVNGNVLVVSFISFGSGIDFKSVPLFEKNLTEFNATNNCNITYEMKTWGREGERDYCFANAETKCLNKYIENVKSSFKNERILIKENGKCKK